MCLSAAEGDEIKSQLLCPAELNAADQLAPNLPRSPCGLLHFRATPFNT
jgi:hypothetical protein